ncbi:MAG: bifunctional 3-deoxy-7-phosphoheptulonate synthase/chorismate mutase type II [Bacteroidales bacterium]|jgi:chorismate mutase|nr:bifunctional 3-deoxy-7-phosphoheptulonate synthase/chorismate mutase type II [Bacteroidales bacterium]HHV40006.1 bifunctional 3-deoxy-7-phosphoheptulonate synthase/chorismate mutase type II [Bacteroidales bacterium]
MHPPIIVAGPCSAETQEQVQQTALELKDFTMSPSAGGKGISFFRAGLWKPRTQADTFQGVGEEGLFWLKHVQETTGLSVCTEAASARHVEKILEAGLEGVWLGARTTANPFLTEEIAKALEGTQLHVFVKNPINPDLNLWIGAVERVLQYHPQNVYAIHRGFSHYYSGKLRNAPLWRIPVEFKVRMPGIPLLCDPSHLAGNREYIQELAQRALNLGFDGLMVEVHPAPDKAWTDGAQQMEPREFRELMHTLSWRKSFPSDDPQQDETQLMDALRARIDVLDDDLIDLLAQRMSLADAIGTIKKRRGIGIVQTGRWKQICDKIEKLAVEKGLDTDFVGEIYQAIHQESIKRQEKIIGDE